jgi:hypothetical protein
MKSIKTNGMMEVKMKTIIAILVLAVLTGCAVVPVAPVQSRAYYAYPVPPPPPMYVYHRHRPQYPFHGERRYMNSYGYYR